MGLFAEDTIDLIFFFFLQMKANAKRLTFNAYEEKCIFVPSNACSLHLNEAIKDQEHSPLKCVLL